MYPKQILNILTKLDKHNMQVHEIDHSAGYAGFKQPIAHLAISTHYITQGEEIVHVGIFETVRLFVSRLS